MSLILCFDPVACGQAQSGTPLHPSAVPAPVAVINPAGSAGPASDGATRSEALTLDTGDLLDVRVFDTPELSEKLRVDNLGDVVLPVGGAVTVRGLTAEQAQAAMEARFRQKKILRDPHVEVFVLEVCDAGCHPCRRD